jgi:hypothetical protein
MPPELLIAGVPIVVIVPLLVQGAKELFLPARYAGVAAMVAAAIVLGLIDLKTDPRFGGWAEWLLLSIVYGLAASGLYSQVKSRAAQQ